MSGVLHHIMIRGIERRKIFLHERDRKDFLEPLSTIMRRFLTECSVSFNRRHSRHGQLFQNIAFLVEAYLKTVDFTVYLELAEDLNMRLIDTVKNADT